MSFKAYAILFCILLYGNNIYSQTTYFIKYKSYVTRAQISNKIVSGNLLSAQPTALKKTNITVSYFARNLGKSDGVLSRIIKVTLPDNTNAVNFEAAIKTDPSVEYIEPENIYKIDSVPNDSLISQQWALEKIDAFDAWNITEGSDTVLIGLIDTGIDYLHPDLKNKIYINPGEEGIDNSGNNKNNNGIDDDGNGFIDDYMGWDFTDRKGFPFDSTAGDYVGWDNNPMDENGHGTYIAGIIGAQTNNKIGIAGTAPNIRILNIRAFDANGYGEEDDVAAGILYAVKMGVKVINMSFGDTQFSYVLKDVIKYAYDRGVVLVASSGNSGSDEPHYPSGYSEVISVGNSTKDDNIAPSSNFGSTLDLVAPGTDILTTAPGGGYTNVSGTSASAPFVSAAAGLILSLGNFTNEEVKQILKSTADDIQSPGWDELSGAGRLNLFKAVSVVAPSVIKFNYPVQDFATDSDSLRINATILSAYFKSYSLLIGKGFDPNTWTTLIQSGIYQFDNKNIYDLNISSFPDTVYCLRLIVNLSNGFTSEERVNFYVERTPPNASLIFSQSALYGNKPTEIAAVKTDQPSSVLLYYRKIGNISFNMTYLDGFATNIRTVQKDHYGFIPPFLLAPNSNYEFYFEAVNLVGLKSRIPNDSSFFTFNSLFNYEPGYEKVEPYTLPAGSIYHNAVNITSKDSDEVFLRTLSNPSTTYLYRLNGQIFTKIDSLPDRIVKDVGDFNDNGKKDLLTYLVYNGYIDEQDTEGSTYFSEKFKDTSGVFWPIAARDLYKNGSTQILAVDSDTSFVVRDVNKDLSLGPPIRLFNYTEKGSWNNYIDAPHAVFGDIDSSGKNEIWMIDKEGDIFSYLIDAPGNFQKGKSVSTGLESSSAYITSGNYTGDGSKDIAVLLNSPEGTSTVPFFYLNIFRFEKDSLITLYNQMFINPAAEFNSSFNSSQNCIRFADLDNDGKDELILFIFPYSYIFKFINGENKIISYKENINSSSIFIGDLDNDGSKEVGFPTAEGISFSRFTTSNIASAPYNLSGFSADSVHISLNWSGSESKYYIFRGTDQNKLTILDSTSNNNYSDLKISPHKYYFYSIKSYDPAKLYPLSNFCNIISVYSHEPGRIISAYSNTNRTVIVKFSERIDTKIDNPQAFNVIGYGYPSSIAAADQFSYMLNYDNPLSAGSYILELNGLSDYYGSPIVPDTVKFTVNSYSAADEFFIVSHEIQNPYSIKIDFNLPVDSLSAVNTSNYIFTPENKITGIKLDDDRKTIYLSLKGSKPVGSIGIEYTLKLKNITSSSSSGNIKINSGAGSYIVLSGFAENLSDVFVYPSPVRINAGEGKLTFANLPQISRIDIFDLNGKRISVVEDRSGSGGAIYNLRDEQGNLIHSGIYIYRIVKLNEQNNEVEEKIGKFAVIR